MRFGHRWVTKTVISIGLVLPNFAPSFALADYYSVDPVFQPTRQPKYLVPQSFPNSDFFTLAPDVKTIGPVLTTADADDMAAHEDYYQRIFRHIVRQADMKIHDDPFFGYQDGSNQNFTYYTFLVLALAIPLQESHITHFRQAIGGQCDSSVNSFAPMGPGTREVMAPAYRDPLRPLMPDCRYLKDLPNVTQLMYSSSHGDVGIMQMNARFHPAAMDPSVLMDVYSSIDAGIDFIWSGFEVLHDNYDKKKIGCIKKSDPFPSTKRNPSKPAVFFNLAEASWSHSYNGQPLCSDTSKDALFERNLLSIVRDDSSPYQYYLPKGTIERAALDEIVANFRAAFSATPVREQNAALKQILNSGDSPTPPWLMPQRTLVAPTHFLRKGKISVYSQPVPQPELSCGYLQSGGYGGERVRVLDSTLQDGKSWSRIQLPAYVTFAHIASQVQMLELRNGVSASNVRSSMVVDSSTFVRTVRRDQFGHSPVFRLTSEKRDPEGRLWYSMVDDSGAVLFAIAANFQKFYKDAPPAGACAQSVFYVRSIDLKKLPPTYLSGRKYKAVIYKKGLLNLMPMPSKEAIPKVILMPGIPVTVIGEKKNGFGEQWYEVLTDVTGSDALWAPQDRIELLHEIRSRGR